MVLTIAVGKEAVQVILNFCLAYSFFQECFEKHAVHEELIDCKIQHCTKGLEYKTVATVFKVVIFTASESLFADIAGTGAQAARAGRTPNPGPHQPGLTCGTPRPTWTSSCSSTKERNGGVVRWFLSLAVFQRRHRMLARFLSFPHLTSLPVCARSRAYPASAGRKPSRQLVCPEEQSAGRSLQHCFWGPKGVH